PNYSDNSDDIDGWKQIFVEVMEANHGGIIQARTVEEFQAKLNAQVQLAVEDHDPVVIRIEEFEFTNSEWNAIKRYFGDSYKPRHPYENVERDAERDAMEAYIRHRENYQEPDAESDNQNTFPSLFTPSTLKEVDRERCGKPQPHPGHI